ncbi:hypothetical protein C1645_817646, partial [Glomus cerebriforme]
EEIQFVDLIKEHNTNWQLISSILSTRTEKDCRIKYEELSKSNSMKRVLQQNNDNDTGFSTVSEDLLLLLFVIISRVRDWTRISRPLGRSPFQCRRRYLDLVGHDSSIESARRTFRRRVNQRFSQGYRPIVIQGILQRVLLDQLNDITTRDPRMEIEYIRNYSRDPRMEIEYICNDSRDPRMEIGYVCHITRDP